MRNYYAVNRKTGERVFCKWEVCNTGMYRVEYYLPKSGFSVIWDRHHSMTACMDVRTSTDNRKSIVTFLIHPSYFVGYDLQHSHCNTVFDGISDCLTDNIKLL